MIWEHSKTGGLFEMLVASVYESSTPKEKELNLFPFNGFVMMGVDEPIKIVRDAFVNEFTFIGFL